MDEIVKCSGVTTRGLCQQPAVRDPEDGEYMTYCDEHGGPAELRSKRMKATNNYRLVQWNSRLARLNKSPEVKSLRDEISILRMLLEEKLNQCKDPLQLVLHTNSISKLILEIEKVVASCHKLETSSNQLISKASMIELSGKIIHIVASQMEDHPERLEIVAREIGKLFSPDESDVEI